MPRSRGGGGGRRPSAAPARPAAPPQQTRQSSTAAAPPARQQQAGQGQQQQGPGLFGQMASTAAGVAVGSSIGHALGGWFGGGSQGVEEQQMGAAQDNAMSSQTYNACQTDITNFRKCMDDNQGSLTICGWYLDQLKACQAAASQY